MINRQQLDEIIMRNTDAWWKPNLFVKKTLSLLPKEIEVLKYPPSSEKNYNCFIYAFSLSQNTAFIEKTNGFIYDTLVLKLIADGHLLITEEPEDGDYIVYQDKESNPQYLTHIGVIEGEKIVSKWAWGPLIRHSVWSVPQSYGNHIFYLKKVTSDYFLELFKKYQKYNVKQEEPNKKNTGA